MIKGHIYARPIKDRRGRSNNLFTATTYDILEPLKVDSRRKVWAVVAYLVGTGVSRNNIAAAPFNLSLIHI